MRCVRQILFLLTLTLGTFHCSVTLGEINLIEFEALSLEKKKQTLASAIQEYQARVWSQGKVLKVAGTLISLSRVSSPARSLGSVDAIFDRDLTKYMSHIRTKAKGNFSTSSRAIGWNGAKLVSVTSTKRDNIEAWTLNEKPQIAEILPSLYFSGLQIALSKHPNADKSLGLPGKDSFLLELLALSKSVEVNHDDELIKITIEGLNSCEVRCDFAVDSDVYCVRLDQRHDSGARWQIEIDYAHHRGLALPAAYRRKVLLRQGREDKFVKLAAAKELRIDSLQFFEDTSDNDFLPSIPEGITVRNLQAEVVAEKHQSDRSKRERNDS